VTYDASDVAQSPMMSRERRITRDGRVIVGTLFNDRGEPPFGHAPYFGWQLDELSQTGMRDFITGECSVHHKLNMTCMCQ
jgi:hypothetical protein